MIILWKCEFHSSFARSVLHCRGFHFMNGPDEALKCSETLQQVAIGVSVMQN